MTQLREQRERLSISQAHLAFLLGTSQPNVSAYEAGELEVGALTAARIDAFMHLQPTTLHTSSWLGTCASHARTLKSELRRITARDRDEFVARSIIGMNDAFNTAIATTHLHSDLEFFLIPPGSTGDHGVDVFLAGMAVHWARSADLPRVPSWTRGLAVDGMWWVGLPEAAPKLRARAFANALPSLRARGIVFDARSLASV